MSFSVINTEEYLTKEARAYLKENDCRIRECVLEELTEDEFCRQIPGVEAVISGGERWTEKVFQAADRIKIVARVGAGYDSIDLSAASKHGVWVTNTPGATSHAVADFTLGLILCLLRNIHDMAQDMKKGNWNQFQGIELGSLTLGIVGTGSIGRQVIKRAKGFGARVLATDIAPDHKFAEKWQVQYVPLDELMADSDIVSIHVLLNEKTRGLIDGPRLKLMKKQSYLINTSRAAIVEKEALLKVLKAKEISGAAIDVHDPAPCSPDDPLVHLDNVIATPWTAYNTKEAVMRMFRTAAHDVLAVLQGEVPKFPVNKL